MTISLKFYSRLQSLEKVCMLEYEVFTEDEMIAFVEFLKGNKVIEALSLTHQKVTKASVSGLSDALMINRTLKTLMIDLDKVDSGCAVVLFHALKMNKSITTLALESSYFSLDLLSELIECFKWNTTIKKLKLDRCVFEEGGVSRLAEILLENNTLEDLCLSSVGCGVEGARALAQSLTVNSSLMSLDLSHNQLGDAGVAVLAESLKENTGLKSLNLHRNKIGPVGVKALAGLIKADTPIETLNILNNNYSIYDCKTLFKAHKKNFSIRYLYVDVCDQSDYGFRTGFQALPPEGFFLCKSRLDSSNYDTRNRICYYFNKELAQAVTAVYALNVKDDIKACVLKHKGNIESRLKTLAFEKQYFGDKVYNLFDSFMRSVFHWVHADIKDLASTFDQVVAGMSVIIDVSGATLSDLPEHFFAKEFMRFMTGCMHAMNASELESQANALLCFLHPFKNQYIQSRAVVELFSMLDKTLTAALFKNHDETRALDILLLSLCKHCPDRREILLLAIAACARLERVDTPKMKASIDLLNNTSHELLIEKFEKTLRELAQNENLPLNLFLNNHREKMLNTLSNTRTPSTPSPRETHGLFLPAATPGVTEDDFKYCKLNQ